MRKFFIIILTLMISAASHVIRIYANEEMKLQVGEIRMIPANNPTRIAIGNPSVADVLEAKKDGITLTAKGAGTTTFVFWDNFGEQSYRIKVFTEDINEIKRRIDNLLAKLNLPEVRTQAAEDEEKVILLGRVKHSRDMERISLALGALKGKTIDLIEVKEEEAVIEIDVHVLELATDVEKTLGFTTPLNSQVKITEVNSPGLVAAKWSELFKVLALKRDTAFSWTLDALVKEGKARVLSRPRLACQSGKEATLLVGGEKPIFTTQLSWSSSSSGTSVEYKEYGIKLSIKPTVTEDKRIKLALNVDISELGSVETLGSAASPTAKAYPIKKRSALTELFLDDGQTMAIGGLIRQKMEEDVQKPLFLGDIPILGLFFRKRTTKLGGGTGERGDMELFITLTPKIVSRDSKEAPETTEREVASTFTKTPAISKKEKIIDPVSGYISAVQKRILESLIYPPSAKESGFTGTVKLSLHLSYQGELMEVLIKSSSGYSILDANAVGTAKEIASYPPFPSSMAQEEIWIDIPIAYKLD